MSVGNVTQAINFDRKDLTLVLGENLDLGGDDSGARNGTGKTTIANALSYTFYGQALTSIKRDNLINKTNEKGMLTTIEFEKDGQSYRIERGRRPGILSLFKGDVAFESKDNDAQGDSRETQHEINSIIAMSHDMFRHVVALNTYTEPFLSLKAFDQRTIIEQLLGITILSEKAEALKEKIKAAKELITKEEYRIAAIIEANKKIEEQVAALKRRKNLWDTKHSADIAELSDSLAKLLTIDIDQELANHSLLADFLKKEKDRYDLDVELSRTRKDLTRELNSINKLKPEIELLENHQCHSCGQKIHNDQQAKTLNAKIESLATHSAKMVELEQFIDAIQSGIDSLGPIEGKTKVCYPNIKDAFNHKNSIENIEKSLAEKRAEDNPYDEQIHEMETTALSEVSYDVINDTTTLKEHQEFLLKLLIRNNQ